MAGENIFYKRDLAFLALLAMLPLLGYQFGIGNQVEQFPIVLRLADPTFLAGDFYVDSAAKFGPRFYYSAFLALLTKAAPLPAVILALTWLSSVATALVTFWTARRHFGASGVGAAYGAAFAILNTSFALGLAGFIRFESFQPASVAIPFALLGLALLLDGRRYLASGAFAASAIFHPLIGVEIAIISYAACSAADVFSRRSLAPILKYLPSGALFSAIVFCVWVLPAIGVHSDRLTDEEFFSILPQFRSPHHYLATTFPVTQYISAGVFLAGIGLLAFRAARDEKPDVARLAAIFAVALVVLLCAASAYFVDAAHDRIWATAQVFRNLSLIKWFGFLFFAGFASQVLAGGKPARVVALFVALVATAESQPFVMFGVIGLIWLLERSARARAFELPLAAIFIAGSAGLVLFAGTMEDSARAVVAAVLIALLYLAPISGRVTIAASAGVVGALILLGVVNRDVRFTNVAIFSPTYDWADLDGEKVEIARWAREKTQDGAIWITPPDFENFRLIAERPVVVDFTSIPFNEEAMREWRRRMEDLYGPISGQGFAALQVMRNNYGAATPETLAGTGARYDAGYAVLYAQTPWNGPVLYQNREYKAVALSPR